jgi:ubiquinone/menaquinone biosynthesis C-methylase UbiE
MGFYDRTILPTCIDLVMRVGQSEKFRRKVLGSARGDVLELGVGSGLNFPFYPQAVSSVVGLEPSARLLAMAAKRAHSAPCPVRLLAATAEVLPFAVARFDTVVTTWTLCSIPSLDLALAEVRRVLKPDGRLVFVEHGFAPDPSVSRWQARLNPWWKPLAGGCHLDRKIDELIADAGFRFLELDAGYHGFRVTGFTFRGLAVSS